MDLATRPPVPDVPELWYHILAFLRGRTSDLKSLALVSRTFCSAAQSVLFYDIDLEPSRLEKEENDGSLISLKTEDFDAACRRLGAVLAESPHLVKYIRRLKVTLTSGVLAELSSMGLTSLRDIAINFLNYRVDEALVGALHDFIGLPSIRAVELGLDVSARIFSGPISHLTSLSFIRVRQFTPELESLPNSTGEGRPEIKTLVLHGSAALDDWLVHPKCPFNLTRLVDVDISVGVGRMSAKRLQLLHAARLTIERLTLVA
ncbi:hypothetical protein DFH09DRAFT_1286770, partial [Mycena vulgaris]